MSHFIPKRQTFAFPFSRPTASGAGGSDGTFIAVHNESLLKFKKHPEEWVTCGIDSYAISKEKIYSEIEEMIKEFGREFGQDLTVTENTDVDHNEVGLTVKKEGEIQCSAQDIKSVGS